MKIIQLSQGYEALIDNEDFDRVSQYKWHLFTARNSKKGIKNFYAIRTDHKNNTSIRLHRFILNASNNIHVDHINGNGLDNQKLNLRIATNSQNQANKGMNKNNTVGFKGVTYRKKLDKYVAQITFNNVNYYLGIYKDPKKAAKAYNLAAIKYFGEYARLNVI